MKKLLLVCAFVSALVLSACSSSPKVELAVRIAAKECPIDAGDGLVITNITTEDQNVIYTCVMDEASAGVTVKQMNEPAIIMLMKAEMLKAIKAEDDKDMKEFVEIIKDSKYNVVYRFVGSQTNEGLDIVIYNHEL